MRIAQRLYLAVIPGILGLFAVAALAYWGQYAHRAPEIVVVVAMIATVASLAMAWYNTRYVARRVERLATTAASSGASQRSNTTATIRDVANMMTVGAVSDSGRPDELDEIETTVQRLSGAVLLARDEALQKERAAMVRAEEYQSILADVMELMASRLQDAELPLHVLLSSPFGALNENQEELLSAAQSAIGIADEEVRHLKQLIELDRGAVPVRLQPVNLAELLRPALAIAGAHARRARIDLQSDVSDTCSRVVVDPVQVQEALTAVLDWAVTSVTTGVPLVLRAVDGDTGVIRITLSHPAITDGTRMPVTMLIAARLIAMQHGAITREPGSLTVQLQSEPIRSLRSTNTSPTIVPTRG